jgi:hypothetical protein
VRTTHERRDRIRVVKLVCCECRMGFRHCASWGSEVIQVGDLHVQSGVKVHGGNQQGQRRAKGRGTVSPSRRQARHESTTVRLCSVSSIGLDELTDDGAAPGFRFKSIVKAYRKQSSIPPICTYSRHTTMEQTSPTTRLHLISWGSTRGRDGHSKKAVPRIY